MALSNLRSRRQSVPVAQARVLIVEDTLENLVLLERMLIFSGVLVENCVHKATGTGVLQFVETVDPLDLILLDLNLPDRDGLMLARDLRSAGVLIPIIAVSAAGLGTNKQLCLEAGCTDYVSKPFTFNQMCHCLSRYQHE